MNVFRNLLSNSLEFSTWRSRKVKLNHQPMTFAPHATLDGHQKTATSVPVEFRIRQFSVLLSEKPYDRPK